MMNQNKSRDMKKLLLKKSIILILYTLANLYFMGFNWKLFTTSLNINLGFGVVTFPPFIVLFFLGFILIGILSWMNYISGLQKIIYELKNGDKNGKVNEKMVSKRVRRQLLDEENLKLMKEKLGIEDIRSKQEELIRSLSELKHHLQKE